MEAAGTFGGGIYVRTDLCRAHYFTWFTSLRRIEDATERRAKHPEELRPEPKPVEGMPKTTPTWKKGRNVKIREKTCSHCGYLIDIRRGEDGDALSRRAPVARTPPVPGQVGYWPK